ncbi:CHAT domain-containing protein/tetratricopeptide (TPR) repeat protein [Variovorax sp. TBS-050B]|uniref:CHAT domain-containing tetratricopeptide repeat protein n=1 Tax=Variovorax sp. TBS-050B TaxID=2940551 RepID=UPI00247470FD|nr:CHAT domain-containing protein [Variovorax sp. TBS-050B]MDH6590430.1 CHAT domain-containing protein/tetratricopeptide (TPR) repeat protein [Variovorax sp. TBS-050B]
MRILDGPLLPLRDKVVEARGLAQRGAFRDAEDLLQQSLDTVADEAANPMRPYLARDLLLDRLIDNAAARFDDEAQLRFIDRKVALRTAFWGADANATLAARNAFALQLCKLGRCAEALEMQDEIERKTLALAGPDARNTLVARHNRTVTLAQMGRYAEALEASQGLAARAEARWGANDATTLRFRNAVATFYTDLGRYAEALALHERVYEARKTTLGASAPDTLSSLASLSASYSALARRREALALSQRLHELSAAAYGPQHPGTLNAAAALALELRRAGRLEEARRMAAATWERLREVLGPRHPDTLYAMNIHASILEQMGAHAEALAVSTQAYEARREVMGELHPLTLAARQSLGRALLSAGDTQRALAELTQAHEGHARLLGLQHPYTLLALVERLRAAIAADRIDDVRHLLPAFRTDVEALRAQHGLSSKSRRTLFERYVEGYRHYALASLREGASEQAFQLAELSKARTLLESTALQRANRAGVLPSAAQEAVERHEAELAALDRALDEAKGQTDRRQALESERNRVVRAYADLQRELRERHPKYRLLMDPPQATLADAAKLLPANSAFLSYLTDGDRVLAFVVERRGLVQAVELPALPGLSDTVEAYRKLVGDALEGGQAVWKLGPARYRIAPSNTPPAPGAEQVGDARPIGELLASHLLAPLASATAGRERLIVSPDAALALLPFEALPVGGEPLTRRHDVSYVQSLSMLALLQSRTAEYRQLRARRTLLAVGNPRYQGGAEAPRPAAARSAADGGAVDAVAAAQSLAETETEVDVDEAIGMLREASWENLPGTAREIEAVRGVVRRGRVDTLTGDSATESKLRSLDREGELSKYRYLLFSVHGYLSTAVPALSALVLGQVANPPGIDGYLTAAEWPGYTLRSDLVVMSACDTGVGKVVHGEGVMGLPYALYVAGNTSTLMTLWPVADESTARFMTAFFARLSANETPQQALSATKRAFADGAHGEKLRKPAYWAPFVLYGS